MSKEAKLIIYQLPDGRKWDVVEGKFIEGDLKGTSYFIFHGPEEGLELLKNGDLSPFRDYLVSLTGKPIPRENYTKATTEPCDTVSVKDTVTPTDLVSNLDIVKFKYINDTRTTFGVIAQELEKIFPRDKYSIVTEDKNGVLMVDYAQLACLYLVEARRLQREVYDLRDEVQHLREKVKNLNAEIIDRIYVRYS